MINLLLVSLSLNLAFMANLHLKPLKPLLKHPSQIIADCFVDGMEDRCPCEKVWGAATGVLVLVHILFRFRAPAFGIKGRIVVEYHAEYFDADAETDVFLERVFVEGFAEDFLAEFAE